MGSHHSSSKAGADKAGSTSDTKSETKSETKHSTTPSTTPSTTRGPDSKLDPNAPGSAGTIYSTANQVARYQNAQNEGNTRYLDIGTVFDPAPLRGKRVLVVGAGRGLGFETVRCLKECGAIVIATTRKQNEALSELATQVITGIELTSDDCVAKIPKEISAPLDVVIYNAGYFKEERERLATVDTSEDLKMIDICAVAPLRVMKALHTAHLLGVGCKVVLITSQAGSVAWREHQNPEGDNYGHHMSRAATNMMGRLLSFELKADGIPVALLHPGFNRTEMTQKYAEIWDKEGAVDPSIGAKRVLHEVNSLSMSTTGQFINCEDGLQIPW
eukprot:CAMPEP_0184553696 /NCGR_PEP_ID=MMETSP0199_2-20130426/32964_1 /TAXON_ID=1112570 /ORGANISM="Thraustochytrium sp., Strain LLF1b" /LENGTH=329 /DNA_ID=CAMNT_0026949525 /DNA_START=40 /DNA_END=1029 /DNA_ORIENTATION=-